MIRVAIETATSFGTVAVGRGDQVLAEVGLGVQTRHAEAVLPALEAALSLAGVPRTAIEAVVVGAGPGSFTGVRVAAATAKGLVAALGVPLLAYPSLLALAAAVPGGRPVCALFDARRGEVYGGCWRVTGEAVTMVLEPRVGPVTEVAAAARAAGPTGPSPLFVGDGALRYRARLEQEPVTAVPAHPRASTLLWLAEHHGSGATVGHPRTWEPLYVRGSSAERGVAG
jgi:tRNA threonylcarbamoyladenosine biosynthesis protein TsaB